MKSAEREHSTPHCQQPVTFLRRECSAVHLKCKQTDQQRPQDLDAGLLAREPTAKLHQRRTGLGASWMLTKGAVWHMFVTPNLWTILEAKVTLHGHEQVVNLAPELLQTAQLLSRMRQQVLVLLHAYMNLLQKQTLRHSGYEVHA